MSPVQAESAKIPIGPSSGSLSPCLPVSLSHHLPGPPPRQLALHITRAGWAWLVLAAILWTTGLFKGINLLSFLGLLMLAAWVIHWLGSRRSLRQISLHRRTDELVFAQIPFRVTIEASNLGRRARLGLVVEDHGADHFWSSFIPQLKAGGKSRLGAEMVIRRRGVYSWAAPAVRSGFPLGLIEQRLQVGGDDQFVVFPRLGHLHRSRLRRLLRSGSPSLGRARTHPRRHPAAQSDFHGLRAFRSGDSPHWIHWRTSARLGELMVREFEETPNDNLVLILDPWLPQSEASGQALGVRGQEPEVRSQSSEVNQSSEAGGQRLTQGSSHQALEDAISLAATICWEWCRPGGDQFVLAVADKNPFVLHGVTGHDLGVEMLTSLAQVSGTSGSDVEQLAAALRPVLPPGPILLLSTRSGDLKEILEQELHRPITGINISDVAGRDFFEWETSQRSEVRSQQ